MKTKIKTSLTLSREVVRGIDRVAGRKRSRSAVIDHVLHHYLAHRARAAENAEDAEKINRFADELNAEAEDVVGYQAFDALWDEPR
jgi:metal-responsive CopG/Arc/MetJ family transcriptional regulator